MRKEIREYESFLVFLSGYKKATYAGIEKKFLLAWAGEQIDQYKKTIKLLQEK